MRLRLVRELVGFCTCCAAGIDGLFLCELGMGPRLLNLLASPLRTVSTNSIGSPESSSTMFLGGIRACDGDDDCVCLDNDAVEGDIWAVSR